jgi:hypothetical protein
MVIFLNGSQCSFGDTEIQCDALSSSFKPRYEQQQIQNPKEALRDRKRPPFLDRYLSILSETINLSFYLGQVFSARFLGISSPLSAMHLCNPQAEPLHPSKERAYF